MVSFLVYFDGRCKCPLCTVIGWIVFMIVAVLCMWLSYVCCDHLMCMCGHPMCIDCIDVLLLTVLMLYLDARVLASSQYPDGHATGHLGTGFLGFPCV
jgi:hypothetical protein